MDKAFLVRLLMEFPGGYRIDALDEPATTEILDHSAELSAEGNHYVLMVKGVESEHAARILLRKIHAGLCWASLDLKTGIRASAEPQKTTYCEDADKAGKNLILDRPVDAVIETARPAIVRQDARLARISAGSVTAFVSTKPERFFIALGEGLEQASQETFATGNEERERIATAFELYVLSHFEPNTVPRFLLQCAALEVVAPPGEREPAHIVAQVEAWVNESSVRAGEHVDPECKRELNRLVSRVGQLKSISHSERIRRFALQALGSAAVGDVEDKIKRLTDAYKARSLFLHNGDRSKISGAAPHMNDILPVLLKAAMKGGSNLTD